MSQVVRANQVGQTRADAEQADKFQEQRIAGFLRGHAQYLQEELRTQNRETPTNHEPYKSACVIFGVPATIGGLLDLAKSLTDGTLQLKPDVQRLFPHRFGD